MDRKINNNQKNGYNGARFSQTACDVPESHITSNLRIIVDIVRLVANLLSNFISGSISPTL